MNKLKFLSVFLFLGPTGSSCPVCEKQQPKILRGIVHGAGPESNWDYVIIWTAVVIVVFTLFFSIKCLIRPGEKSSTHIKRFILNNE